MTEFVFHSAGAFLKEGVFFNFLVFDRYISAVDIRPPCGAPCSHGSGIVKADNIKIAVVVAVVLVKIDLIFKRRQRFRDQTFRRGLSNRTKISRHNTIRAFSVYANARDGVSFVPETSKLKSTSTFRPHIFTKDELSRIFYSADHLPVRNNAPFRHFIIPAVFRLLYCCGFRIGEVVSLKIQDIDFENNVIYIKNAKGGKERLVPISDGLALYLQDYLSHISKDSEWLFPSLFGHYATGTIYGHTFAVHSLEKQEAALFLCRSLFCAARAFACSKVSGFDLIASTSFFIGSYFHERSDSKHPAFLIPPR